MTKRTDGLTDYEDLTLPQKMQARDFAGSMKSTSYSGAEEMAFRLAALLKEAEDAGIETPAYIVLRDADFSKEHGCARVVNRDTNFIKIVGRANDPWADYRHGSIKSLCPNYKGDHA